MAGWFLRLIGRASPAAAAAAATPTTSPATPAPPRASTGVLNPAPPAPLASAPAGTAALRAAPPFAAEGVAAPAAPPFGVRRPLVGSKGSVAGFELSLPPSLQRRLKERSAGGGGPAPAAQAAHQAMLLAAAAPLCKSGRLVLVTLDASTLVLPGVAQQAAPGALLCVPDLAQLPAAAAAALRARGVRLGVPNGPPGQAPAADFVWLPAEAGGLDTLLLSAQRWRQQRAPLPLLATGLQHLDDVERVLRAGFTLVGGALDRGQGVQAQKPLSAAAQRICGLLNLLTQDQDTHPIAEAVRADVALSYRLLRYANSPALGLRHTVESVDAAVQLLGRQELQRWLQVLLLTVGDSRQASRALQEMALARGRLLEALARVRGQQAPQALFTVGLLSLLEVLLQTPLAEALVPLRLPEPLVQALLQRQGPLAPYLQLAEALDVGFGAALEPAAAPFGGVEAVQALADEAWAWAAVMSASAAPTQPAAQPAAPAAASGLATAL